jgi:uncharacterized protein YdeI (YjbR/CyaY-like superfamily)
MGKKDPRVDAYIEQSADFAKPILRYLRSVVHEACPGCEETLKWRFPHFMYHGMLASMASFKEHCAFGYWKGSLVVDAESRSADAMGQLGRITALADLPPKTTLVRWTRHAAALNDEGIAVKRKPAAKTPVRIPPDLLAALKKHRKAQSVFGAFSPSKKREYIEWLTEAKTEDTRPAPRNRARVDRRGEVQELEIRERLTIHLTRFLHVRQWHASRFQTDHDLFALVQVEHSIAHRFIGHQVSGDLLWRTKLFFDFPLC